MRPTRFSILGVVARYSEAAPLLKKPGNCAVVERGGTRRQIVISCPDGCGEILSINLDPRSGAAWRLYQRRGRWSLFPSIYRTSGCRSHFIMWGDHIAWCDFEGGGAEPEWPTTLSNRVLKSLRRRSPTKFVAIADELDEVPWDVRAACHHLVRRGLLVEGDEKDRGTFSLVE
jgi:uncharacterized protein DUF6527